jgi:hypothetical protein
MNALALLNPSTKVSLLNSRDLKYTFLFLFLESSRFPKIFLGIHEIDLLF